MPTPSELELQVFRWIRLHSDDPALRSQLEDVEVSGREHTGVGCFSSLSVSAEKPVSTEAYAAHGPLVGPGFDAEHLKHGGGTLLWFEAGRMDGLEISSYGETFPQDHGDLGALSLMPPPPDSGSGK